MTDDAQNDTQPEPTEAETTVDEPTPGDKPGENDAPGDYSASQESEATDRPSEEIVADQAAQREAEEAASGEDDGA